MHLSRTLSLVALSSLSLAAAQNVSISLPASMPTNATLLDPRLCSMSLEFQSLEYFAGDLGSPNQFTHNVVQNLVDRTGQPPAVRVGGDTQDRTYYDPSVLAVRLPPGNASVPNPKQMQIYVGPDFFKLAKNLPKNTMVTFGVNLKFDNITDAVDEAMAIMNAFPEGKAGDVILERLEIGNEPNDYGYFEGSTDYAARWTEFAQNISQALNFTPGQGPYFQAGDYGGYSTNWTLTDLLETNIVSGATGARINTVAQHNYMGDGATGTIQVLLDKSFVRSMLGIFKPDIAYANSKGYNYILGECNSFYNGGATNASNTGATAVWATDYSLQAASLNITRTYYHNNIATGYEHYYPSAYNIWEPVGNVVVGNITTTKPQIQPQYHAFLVVAEAIGNTGKSRIAEIYVGSNHVSAYGIWENDALVRIVVINQQPWTFASTGARPVTTVQLQDLESKNATYKSLYIPYADVAGGLTWAGQNFTTDSGLPSGSVVSQKLKNGQIDTLATSVNLITLQ